MPSDRAVVVFTSDESNQGSGFAITWDQGLYCDPLTTVLAPQGTVSDGAPPGRRYRQSSCQHLALCAGQHAMTSRAMGMCRLGSVLKSGDGL